MSGAKLDGLALADWCLCNPVEAAQEIERLRGLLRESQDGIGGDWRARRDAALSKGPTP